MGYYPNCNWLIKLSYVTQELLTTLANNLKLITLQPGDVSGDFELPSMINFV